MTRRRHLPWTVGLLLVLAWVAVVTGLILGAPPRGAADPAELAQQTAVALNSADADRLAALLADPLDRDFAAASIARLQDAGAHDITVAPVEPDLVEVRGAGTAGPFSFRMVAVQNDGRWLLSGLPPVSRSTH